MKFSTLLPRLLLRVAFLTFFGSAALAQSNWTIGAINLPNVNGATGIAYGNGRFVAALSGTSANGVLPPAAAWSTDGVNWTAATLTSPLSGSIVFTAGAFYLAGGTSVLRSVDGQTWSTALTPSGTNLSLRGIASNGRSLLIGNANSNRPAFLYSPDLLTLTDTPALPNLNAPGASGGATLSIPVFGLGRYFAPYTSILSNFSLSPFVASTTDGSGWTLPTGLTGSVGQIAAGNGRVVSINLRDVYISTDGISFQRNPNVVPLNLINGGSIFFAGGRFFFANNLNSSVDGLVWSPLANYTASVTSSFAGIAYGQGRYVAVGRSAAPVGPGNSIVALLQSSAPPVFASTPSSRTIVESSTTIFTVSLENPDTTTTYQWRRDGVAIAGATLPTLTLTGTTLATAGLYTCAVTNPLGTAISDPAQLTVVPFADAGRLISLSVLTSLDAPDTDFTVGFALGGAGASNPKSLLVRAAGPSLSQFGISAFLPDPSLRFFANSVAAGENNDWGGTAALNSVISQTGAFPFTGATTTDAALSVSNVTTTSNTVVIASATPGRGTGSVIAEVYDATPVSSITAATPRLRALSVLKPIVSGTTLTAGFSIGGVTSKNILVRAVGPGLTQINVPGVLSDPLLTLNRIGTPIAIATNDNWGGSASLRDSFTAAGTFALDASSRDSAVVMTLAPGAYTAVASGVANSSGNVLIEIYELP